MSEDFTECGDPNPLARFPRQLTHHAARNVASQYAKENPSANGYVTVVSDTGGYRFYIVHNGKAQSASADECLPNLFTAQRRRIAEGRREWTAGKQKNAINGVEVMEIPTTPGLDPVTVFWQDFAPGKGQVTILCYGAAWTSYWNAMGKETIKQFFATCDDDYLFRNLGLGQHLKQSKVMQTYLLRIIRVVKTAAKS